MDEALAHWLRLREATDWASRSGSLTREIAARLASHDVVHVLDLATGTGSNLRYLVERLPPRQRWLLVDRSPDLLSLVSERTAAWATARGYAVRPTPDGFALEGNGLECLVFTRQMDLNLPLDPVALRRSGTWSRARRFSIWCRRRGCGRWRTAAGTRGRRCCSRSPTTAGRRSRPRSRKTICFAIC